MRIVSWNINSINARMPLILRFIEEYQPTIIAFQETRIQNHSFPNEIFHFNNYPYCKFSGEIGNNGVAIISKIPIKETFSLKFCNDHKRHICTKINDIELHNFYVPAGGEIPDPEINRKFKHKLDYLNEMEKWFQINRSKKDKIILVGDLNIAPYENDVWCSKTMSECVSHTPIERDKLLNVLNSCEFVDIARHFIPQSFKAYSWWSYKNLNWKYNNKGRRLDHIWLTKPLLNQTNSYHTILEARSWQRPSDHIPIFIEFN